MRTSMGVMRNKTHLLYKYKDEQKLQQNRFKKANDLHVPSLRYLQQNEEANSLLLERKNNGSAESTASNYSIELSNTHKALPQDWSHYYEDTMDKIKQVQELIKELHLLGTKRLKLQFGDASVLERQIYETNSKATQKMMECERNIDMISKIQNPEETESDQRIRLNIQRALAQQIQELTNNLRNQQKRMVTLIKQIHKDEGGDFLKLSEQKQNEMKATDGDLTQAEEQLYDDIVLERDQEINKLVTMINELAEVFKSLNQLVLDQGTILDRIDYNIDQTMYNVKQANQQLKKAEEYQNSPTARRCIIVLVALIAICSLLLTIKYSR